MTFAQISVGRHVTEPIHYGDVLPSMQPFEHVKEKSMCANCIYVPEKERRQVLAIESRDGWKFRFSR